MDEKKTSAWLQLLVNLKDQCAITWSLYKEADDKEEQKRMATINGKFDTIYYEALLRLQHPDRYEVVDSYMSFGIHLVSEMQALELSGMDDDVAFMMMLPYAITYTLWEGRYPNEERHNELAQLVSAKSMKTMEDFVKKYEVVEFDY